MGLFGFARALMVSGLARTIFFLWNHVGMIKRSVGMTMVLVLIDYCFHWKSVRLIDRSIKYIEIGRGGERRKWELIRGVFSCYARRSKD